LIGSEVIAERWNKPIEIEKAEGVAVIVAGSEKITCDTNMYTDIFAAGVSILRTEIEIRDKISLNDILIPFIQTPLSWKDLTTSHMQIRG
jgi:hypothetical protein